MAEPFRDAGFAESDMQIPDPEENQETISKESQLAAVVCSRVAFVDCLALLWKTWDHSRRFCPEPSEIANRVSPQPGAAVHCIPR
jgi:hypothetical protein